MLFSYGSYVMSTPPLWRKFFAITHPNLHIFIISAQNHKGMDMAKANIFVDLAEITLFQTRKVLIVLISTILSAGCWYLGVGWAAEEDLMESFKWLWNMIKRETDKVSQLGPTIYWYRNK